MRPLLRALCRFIVHVLRDQNSPRKIAWGIAFGLVIGLAPKFSLFGLLLTLVVICLPINLGSVICSAAFFSFLGLLTSLMEQNIGRFALNFDLARHLLTWISHQPIAAWASLGRPDVVGSLLLSGALFVPTYLISRFVIRHFGQRIDTYLSDFWIYRAVYRSNSIACGAAK